MDNETKQTAGDSFFAAGTVEQYGEIKLERGQTYDLKVTFGTIPTPAYSVPGASAFDAGGLRIGTRRQINRQEELSKAVALAKSVDQVVLCVGLNGDWESEGYDRANMDFLPGSDDLVRAVVAANPTTVVVL